MGMPKSFPPVKALLPMRHNSERVKGKNYRLFADCKPLFEHTLNSLLQARHIEQVIINTDSDIVKEICLKQYPEVIIHDRPVHLTNGDIPMNEIIADDLKKVGGEYFLQTHSTNPMITSQRFDQAIAEFYSVFPQHDSMFSVTRLQTRLWDELTRPINHNKDILLRTQDLPPIFEENSCFYLFHRRMIEVTSSRIGQRPFMFELDKLETADIDTESDFILAEQLYKLKNQ
jgi:CMP-N-acetylneuraminic acid synthetase